MRGTPPRTRTPVPLIPARATGRGATRARTGRHRRPTPVNESRSCATHERFQTCADGLAWNRERKRGARTVVQRRPETAMMTLDNGPAHRQADPHTAGLRGVERVEEPVRALVLKTHSGILHGQEHAIAFVSSGTDEQLPGPALDRAHRI